MTSSRTYQDASSRWAGVGPYYAMFPVAFADKVVQKYTDPGDSVLDPFAGRGTAIFSAATQKRFAIGIEINPVGYVYGKTKLRPASQEQVHYRLEQVAERSGAFSDEAARLPRFFHRCFSRSVRRFLLAARAELDWRRSRIDRTVMALLLIHLHGKAGDSLSNQMRQAKAMSPQYAVRWWDERGLAPPELDPVDFLKARLEWRYAKGVPAASGGRMYLGDSLHLLNRLRRPIQDGLCPRARLLFTSPPYHGVTNYFYDQWLRLWLLGGPPHALRTGHALSGKFQHHQNYRVLLHRIFTRAAGLLTADATVYVRTDTREFTCETTVEVLREVFPAKRLRRVHRPLHGPSQTQLFGGTSNVREKTGEIDLILSP